MGKSEGERMFRKRTLELDYHVMDIRKIIWKCVNMNRFDSGKGQVGAVVNVVMKLRFP